MNIVICPECKTRRVVDETPDLPQNAHTGVYCEFCAACMEACYPKLLKFRRERKRKNRADDPGREASA